MEVVAKIVKSFSLLTIFAKNSILGISQYSELASEASSDCGKSFVSHVWQGFEFTFVAMNYFCKSVGYLFTEFD